MTNDVILWIVVATALAFDFTNGFHDTANAIATMISTRALAPRVAVAMAATLNFVGAFLSLAVAATIASGIVDPGVITLPIVFSGLIGAIAWNLLTWYFGLPSSSSHALIGGMVGSTFAAVGPKGVMGDGLIEKVIVPALIAPVLAFVAAGLAILICYRIVGSQRPGTVSRGFRLGQLISGSLFSLSHGTNDAQKTMGILFLALVANGNLKATDGVPTWIVVAAASAIAAGTYVGGWRIIRTMGSRIIKMDPAQGFAAQAAGAAVILSASHVGFPLSTTHVISGGIMGAGAAKRVSAVRWGVAGNIVFAWVLTLPASAAVGALTFGVVHLLGEDSAGPIVVSIVLVIALVAVLVRRATGGRPMAAEA
ncbi:MAG: inorganic phosphate transporter, PiT family [Solirubrobacteraceae bacterium]|jgi:PiT family inorganic phosphate transporter|nr:inorganic phosphate transporter, PiT family [Solirubrobacteraceae bacterium]